MSPPPIKIRGIRTPIPGGHVLGRTDQGTGDTQLIPLKDLGQALVAGGGGGGGSPASVASVTQAAALAGGANQAALAALEAAQQARALAGAGTAGEDGQDGMPGAMGPPGPPGPAGSSNAMGPPGFDGDDSGDQAFSIPGNALTPGCSPTLTGIWTFNQNLVQFGASLPFYLMASQPTIGFNLYYSGGWKFGAGSSSSYGAVLDCNTITGDMRFWTANSGNAGGTATLTQAMTLSQVGTLSVAGVIASTLSPATASHFDTSGSIDIGTSAALISSFPIVGLGGGNYFMVIVSEKAVNGGMGIYLCGNGTVQFVSPAGALWQAPSTTPPGGSCSVAFNGTTYSIYNNASTSARFRVMSFRLG